LARNCILIHGARRDLVVLDPFLGIGSSALAALDCGVETFTATSSQGERRTSWNNHHFPVPFRTLHC
jgi:hypothetical protein